MPKHLGIYHESQLSHEPVRYPRLCPSWRLKKHLIRLTPAHGSGIEHIVRRLKNTVLHCKNISQRLIHSHHAAPNITALIMLSNYNWALSKASKAAKVAVAIVFLHSIK